MLVRVLGVKEYTEVWELQRVLADKRRREEIPDTLLLLEHEPVYTRGTSSKAPVPAGLPHPLYTVERGGDLTYHGPGQLVGYPIIHLGEHGLLPRDYLRSLEAVLIEGLRPLGLEAETLRGFTGLWCRGKKIASIGVAVREQVAFHGFAVNLNCALEPFSCIHPCQLEPGELTTVAEILRHPVDFSAAVDSISHAFLSYFVQTYARL